jgi:DNA repair protein RadC
MNVRISKKHKIQVNGVTDIVPIMQEILLRENRRGRNKEHFWCVGLANDHRILYIELVSLGTVNRTLVTPSEVLELAAIKLAVKLILVHNHPSGNLNPSPEDEDRTDEMIQAAKLLHKEILDHIIISPDDFYSFTKAGLMQKLRESKQYVLPYELEALGEKRGKIEMARSLKEQNVEISIIEKSSGLSREEIENL